MGITLNLANSVKAKDNVIYLVDKATALSDTVLTPTELKFAHKQLKEGTDLLPINQYSRILLLAMVPAKQTDNQTLEACRLLGNRTLQHLNDHQVENVVIANLTSNEAVGLAVAEGLALSTYQFLKYKKEKTQLTATLKSIQMLKGQASKNAIEETQNLVDATFKSRDLVNEPLSYLTATQLSKEIAAIGKSGGFKVEVLNKHKIAALKMGGLLAVNAGSLQPPTFNILEYKPPQKTNKKPIILVGKGIVYDTGGLSLKPTPNSMDKMKSDMAGAAATIGVLYAAAKNKLPLHLIGLIPATDNRPGENAYTPGDVVKMHSGSTVEVLNTDAEGRMILADALSYAKRWDPELVMDIATLTGAASKAVGSQGMIMMGTASEDIKHQLKTSGFAVHERLVEFPLWEEYGQMLRSDIADLKNVGGMEAGAITAGKFLEHFTNYPWIHLDIAGVAFIDHKDGYRGKNATGVGVRLLYHFLKNLSST